MMCTYKYISSIKFKCKTNVDKNILSAKYFSVIFIIYTLCLTCSNVEFVFIDESKDTKKYIFLYSIFELYLRSLKNLQFLKCIISFLLKI